MSNTQVSERERKCLFALLETDWQDGFGCLSFRAIARAGRIPLKHVRRSVRALARKGLAAYHSGLWTEDGEPAGSGYCITAAGDAFASKLRGEST